MYITTMARLSSLLVGVLAAHATAQVCPEIPGTGVTIGDPVPMKPENIPAGCSDFEILVARGTSEPDYADGGKFGVVVGDPVVSNTTLALPGARGYPVQVRGCLSEVATFFFMPTSLTLPLVVPRIFGRRHGRTDGRR
jgi:hypothetical protein